MRYALIYESDPEDVAAKATEHGPAHRSRWADFQAAGTLLLLGPLPTALVRLECLRLGPPPRSSRPATRSC
jgi:hypothetical protein